MHYDLRTKKTVEEGIQLREGDEDSIFILYAPGNGTNYLVSLQSFSVCGPKMKERIGIGSTGEGWLVTYLSPVFAVSMVITHIGLLHWEYVWEKLRITTSDAVVLAELIGHVTGRPYISCEEFLAGVEKKETLQTPCCERDSNGDGNCDRHPGSDGPNR